MRGDSAGICREFFLAFLLAAMAIYSTGIALDGASGNDASGPMQDQRETMRFEGFEVHRARFARVIGDQ
jgi:hypothetical protein